MKSFFAVAILSVILCEGHFALGYILSNNNHLSDLVNTNVEFSNFCQFDGANSKAMFLAISINYFVGTVLQLHCIFFIYAIVILKSEDDILQGINKLDHLLKVSYFQ